ncbi:Uncharacterised protein [Vibrio cholerae]|uniref:Uncharacterized protein n=1 Tax=Vibrio cholerae TaxID=666 RepID=A0A655R8E8_VIBCL|nr:Uncharacterised protein [Vibrio cholerae]
MWQGFVQRLRIFSGRNANNPDRVLAQLLLDMTIDHFWCRGSNKLAQARLVIERRLDRCIKHNRVDFLIGMARWGYGFAIFLQKG